jgi:putative ribosome biogenesis GTPase RsgA
MAQADSPTKMGRPTKLTEEIIKQAENYIAGDWEKLKHVMPSAVGLAKVIGVSKKTIYNWADNNDDFLHILAELNTEQEFTLLNNGLTGEFNTAITKLVLTKHDYSDKVSQDVTSSDGSMKPVVVELVGVSSESTAEDS